MGGVLAAVSEAFARYAVSGAIAGYGVSAFWLPSFLIAFGILLRFWVNTGRCLRQIWFILYLRLIRCLVHCVSIVGLDEST